MSDSNTAKPYGRLILGTAVLGALVFADKAFTGPLAFVFGVPDAAIGQWVTAAFAFGLTLIVTRMVKQEFIHGYLERRSGKEIPPLISNILGGLMMFIGITVILAVVFKRDVTGLVATGGGAVMIIGLALRDVFVALFTGILLNVEKPFRVGDLVRINERHTGKVQRITWRTTVIETPTNETIYLPNMSLQNAVIQNMAQPDKRSKRMLEVVIDYDTSVESAERILYAAVQGAHGVKQIGAPTIFARKMERDGVVYEVAFTITDYADGKKSEHAVIKNILQCMRDASITVSFPKQEVIRSERRVAIANRSLDLFHLVQQARLFRGLPDEVCHRITRVMTERHFPAGATLVKAGERRHAMMIIGEGMAKRTLSDREGAKLIHERFIATESFGLRCLFAMQAQVATVTAETAVLAYELDRNALGKLFAETPDLVDTLASALAMQEWREMNGGNPDAEPPPAVLARLVNINRGQIESAYSGFLTARQVAAG